MHGVPNADVFLSRAAHHKPATLIPGGLASLMRSGSRTPSSLPFVMDWRLVRLVFFRVMFVAFVNRFRFADRLWT